MRKGRGCGAEGERTLDSQRASVRWFIRWVLRFSAVHCCEVDVVGEGARDDLEEVGRPL